MNNVFRYAPWDYKSHINGCSPIDTGFLDKQDVYLIYCNDRVIQIQSADKLPEDIKTVEEQCKIICEELSTAVPVEPPADPVQEPNSEPHNQA